MENPIIDNRIIFSHTYAVRNLGFLQSLYPNNIPTQTCSAMDEEEYECLCYIACELVRYQVETCPKSEKWYFENLVKNYKNGDDIIKNHICKNHPEFLNFLKEIKAIK